MIEPFGDTRDGRVHRITLNAGDLTARILTLGAILNDVRLKDVAWPLTLGAPDLAPYLGPMQYSGAIVGPVANRIAGASAMIAGQMYGFEANENGTTTLHGGSTGTQAQIWTIADTGPSHAVLTLHLPDGLGGFPGNRQITARFDVAVPAQLTLHLTAQTDAPTLMNLANHSYWNLDGSPDIAGHRLRIAANQYIEIDDQKLPIGLTDVIGTPFDLRLGCALQTQPTFDTNFCLSSTHRPLTDVAELTGTQGISLTLATTEPGLQVYDAATKRTAPFSGHSGMPYGPFSGIALEPQIWPNAPNRPDFPSVALAPGKTYNQTTSFTFTRP